MTDFANIKKGLCIGGQQVSLPLIQGGMGVGISLSRLAGSVAGAGGVGVISTAQIGFDQEGWEADPLGTNLKAIGTHVQKARAIMEEKQKQEKYKGRKGMIAANIMVATRFYEKYVREAVKAGVDLIISGAGLPASLPEFVKCSKTKIAPIISSLKAARVILRLWDKKYRRVPDLLIIEGPLAGGHLGFSPESLEHIDMDDYDREILEIIDTARVYGAKYGQKIPVAVAGGIDSAKKVRHYLDMGVDGVQVATRFVTTQECDAPMAYKQAYIRAFKEDIRIVKSPVGMPGRAIYNDFMAKVERGERPAIHCHKCLEKCQPSKIPYCITDALINAAKGDVDHALLFCGANAWKAERIMTVDEVIEELFP
ncbi:NAD(P)H-dependent flavin oxidoreductase YrpB (nitropropane dioxygenase family) [Catenibacillus scindens]|uniref:Probable nitronate monooxygenase n=1 Tax=Catenibacillus scindens TaxID=673271 RepID=A0A7W8H9J2_9FIRM|nr:nitronate monooxygenase family protein [Catenibacillus scindens]MBB5264404.1 NAD(P)H-dependent flavin oxidoreductase YrpB (nitropropane dioxygenase family) [Catenibacillus scindens]